MSNHEEKEWEWKGEKFICQPGQIITSLEKIAQTAGKGISVQNVRTALIRFEKHEFLTNESTKQNRLITICKWSDYQNFEMKQKDENQSFVSPLLVDCYQEADAENPTNKLTNEKKDVNVSNTGKYWNIEDETNKEVNSQLTTNNNVNNITRNNIVKNEFEKFRKLYPGSKRGLDTEFENFKKKNSNYNDIFPLLVSAVSKQIAFRKQKSELKQFVPEWPMLSTWINQKRWEEEINEINNETKPEHTGIRLHPALSC